MVGKGDKLDSQLGMRSELGSHKIAGVDVASGIGLDSVSANRRRGTEMRECLYGLGGFSVGETEERSESAAQRRRGKGSLGRDADAMQSQPTNVENKRSSRWCAGFDLWWGQNLEM